ncbi:MAG: N-acetylmuramoyl-L-alanine amidase [bacterium]|nr:N-acetylmuramoyl-L-alanine amidase [bacterium]
MTGPPITRRRFLAAFFAAIGAGVAGATVWLTRSDGGTAMGTTTTIPPPATTVPSATTSTAAPTTTTSPAVTTTSPAVQLIDIVCRDSWGAVPASGDYTPHTIDQITVHHTAVVLGANSDAPGRARQHQQYHQSLDWPDLAYHYLIDANGHVYEGRPVAYVGDTATDYDPTGHFLVCCEGNFNEQEVTAAQYASLVKLVAWGAIEFEVDPAVIGAHRDLATTTCPGDNLYPLVAEGILAGDVAVSITNHELGLNVVCGSAGNELIAAIEDGSA